MSEASQKDTRMLLHACCGPCSMEPVRLLQERGISPVIFYSNSNIHPEDEYEHRLETLRSWAKSDDPALVRSVEVVEDEYNVDNWETAAGKIGDTAIREAKERKEQTTSCGEEFTSYHEALEGGASEEAAITLAVDPERRRARCRACYRVRFEKVARFAAENGFSTLGTTLSVSPYQYTDVIKEELGRAASSFGLTAAFEDYRPHYDEATRRSRARGMYRQNNCGCRISILEAEAERAQRKTQRKIAKAARAKAHEQERAAHEAQMQIKREEHEAYAQKQARKRAILKALRKGERHD